MGKLTGRLFASGASLNDLIHVVLTGDTSQGPSGSSYKAKMKGYSDIIIDGVPYVTGGTYSNGTAIFTNHTGGTFNVTGFFTGNQDVFVTGGTYSNGSLVLKNNTGGTFTVTGFTTGATGFDVFVTGGSYTTGITTFTNNTGGTFNVSTLFEENITVVLQPNDSLGKYHNGDVIPSAGKDIEWIMNDIATDYINPTFSSFSRTNYSPTILDLGQIMVGGLQTFTWGTTTQNNISPNSVSITQNISSTVIGSGLSHLGGSTALTTTDVIVSNTPIQNKVIYTVSGINTHAGVFSRTLTASWQYRWYYGKSALTDLTTEAQVTGLTGTSLVTNVTNSYITVGPAVGQYVYLVVPIGLGQPTDLRDSVAGCFGNNIPYTFLGTVIVTKFGIPTTYNKYRSINTIDGVLTVWLCA